MGDILSVFHPYSGLAPSLQSSEEYALKPDNEARSGVDPCAEPWRPFASRLDFEFAEVAAEAHLSRGTIGRLLKIIRDVAGGDTSFTFKSPTDVDAAWEKASNLQTMVRTHLFLREF